MIEIKIGAHPDHGDLRQQVVKSMAALGFYEHRLAGADPSATGPAPSNPVERVIAKKKGSTKPAEEPKQSIQSGEERVGPEDTAEETAQDDADEEADKTDSEKVTHDGIRAALGEYMQKFGMPAAQEDGPKVIGLALGDKAKTKVSDIPDDQAALKKVLDGVREMITKNPFKREPVKADAKKGK